MRNTVNVIVVLVLFALVVVAHGEETFSHAEEIISEKTECDSLTDNDLEIIGDYYMEQMHPGEAHEAMDEKIGGDGSEQLRSAHIAMAKSFYCGDHGMMSAGMMKSMMSGGMMGSEGEKYSASNGGRHMMNGFGMGSTIGMSALWIVKLAIGAFIVGIIFWWTKKLVIGKK